MYKFHVISCHVLWRELCFLASQSPHIFTFNFLKQGLHTTPDLLRRELQQAIDQAPADCDAILLGYGLCSNGIEGITARAAKLVVMRGHDCITFFLGSKERYQEYFDRHPGTYWYSPGWIDTNAMPSPERHANLLKTYVEKYGQENAAYLMEMEQSWIKNYSRAAYVDLGFYGTDTYKEYTRRCAAWLKWEVDILAGAPGLIKNFVDGHWDREHFLVVEPGQTIMATHDQRLITAK